MVVHELAESQFERRIEERSLDDLPPGDVLVRVHFSSLNYKDALSASGNKGVTRRYPHTPGIDAAGVVEHSSASDLSPGDHVLIGSAEFGANAPGGFSEYARVPASWVMKLPAEMTLRESMAYGTAGITAALSVQRLQEQGVLPTPDAGEVLVTGATGGVGILAVAILAKAGYPVVAATGKQSAAPLLSRLGAREVIGREAVNDASGKALLKGRWAGVVDTVGGNILATALKTTRYGAVVTCCGNVASAMLETTVYPFILRAVSLIGIDVANSPADLRQQLWQKLASEWRLDQLGAIISECTLDELDAEIARTLCGQRLGRVVVKVAA
jgi:putative YhdH/YhfP family quinone oxidoreductase